MYRVPNTSCHCCDDVFYLRPSVISNSQSKTFHCSHKCRSFCSLLKINSHLCEFCKKIYRAKRKEQKFCSKECSNRNRLGISYGAGRLYDKANSIRTMKERLLKTRKYECEICKISDWQGKAIVLQLDHINGDNKDNRRENLRLLCPNCHSQTPTFAGKNIKLKKIHLENRRR